MKKIINASIGIFFQVKNRDFLKLWFQTRDLSEENYGGLWEFPGGGIEIGETPKKALLREIQEEVSLEIEGEDPVFQKIYSHETDAKIVNLYVFLIQYSDLSHKVLDEKGQWFDFEKQKKSNAYPGHFLPANYQIIDEAFDCLTNLAASKNLNEAWQQLKTSRNFFSSH